MSHPRDMAQEPTVLCDQGVSRGSQHSAYDTKLGSLKYQTPVQQEVLNSRDPNTQREEGQHLPRPQGVASHTGLF